MNYNDSQKGGKVEERMIYKIAKTMPI